MESGRGGDPVDQLARADAGDACAGAARCTAPGLAELRSSNRAFLLSLAEGPFLHALGQAEKITQATKQEKVASTDASQY